MSDGIKIFGIRDQWSDSTTWHSERERIRNHTLREQRRNRADRLREMGVDLQTARRVAELMLLAVVGVLHDERVE